MNTNTFCCCSTCENTSAKLGEQMTNYPGEEYFFPADYLMTIRAPITPSLAMCTVAKACYPPPDPINVLLGCGHCINGEIGCCINTNCQCIDCLNLIGCGAYSFPNSEKSHLSAYVWSGMWDDLKAYSTITCSRNPAALDMCWQQDILGQCGAPAVTDIYERNTVGNIAWNNSGVNTNLSYTPIFSQGSWDKYFMAPEYTPQDDCKWVYRVDSPPTYRNAPAFPMGYKTSQIQTYPGVTGSCVAFNAITTQHLGYEIKVPFTSCANPNTICPLPCSQPCVVMFLRVKITGTINKRTTGGIPIGGITSGADSYGCVCVPPGVNPCQVPSGEAAGYFGIPSGGIIGVTPGAFRTDAYYRSYWNGTTTFKEWLEKPFDLYRISSSMIDSPCGADTDIAYTRKYQFATNFIAGDCAYPVGSTGCNNCDHTCTPYVPEPKIPQPCLGCVLTDPGVACGDTSQARLFECSLDSLGHCKGAYAPNDCIGCDGLPGAFDPCKVCEFATVEYPACKTMPGGEFFNQSDIDSMPCDWENIPTKITPVYNPLTPVISTVKSSDACGGIVDGAGNLVGGTLITITGLHLLYAVAVTIGGVPCTDVKSIHNKKATAISPASASIGVKPVVVVTPGGNSNAGNFTYTANAAPSTCLFTPLGGTTNGGTLITCVGRNYIVGATTLTLGDIPCTSVIVLHSGALTCITPAAVPAGFVGERQLKTTTQYGTGTTHQKFIYN